MSENTVSLENQISEAKNKSGLPRVVVVDDKPANTFAISVLLKDLHCETTELGSGAGAISYLKDNEVALILMDVQMPVMDGLEAARIIRSLPNHTKTPIIFLTASDHRQEDIFEAYKSGAVDFIFKPIDNTILLSKVSVFLELFEFRRKAIQETKDEADKKVEASFQKYQTFISQSSEGMWRFEISEPISILLPVEDQLQKIIDSSFLAECNDAMARMYGLTKGEELIGFKLKDFFLPDDPKNIEFITAFIKSNYKLANVESVELDRQGRIKHFSNSLVGIIENDCLARAWGTQRDITQEVHAREAAEKAKDEAERANRLKTAFLANMSHEIRTPLGAMIGFADLLRDPNITDEEKSNYIDILHRNGEQLNHIINDILDLSKIEVGHLSFEYVWAQPAQLVNEVISLLSVLADERGINLKFKKEDSIPKVIVTDPTRFRQILMNIIGNALKFTKVGTVEITLSGYESVSGHQGVNCKVTDTGIGVPEDSIPSLFKMFSQVDNSMTRKYGGTGLGLALSRSLARAMGGDIRLISTKVDCGTTFLISIESQDEQLIRATPEESLTTPTNSKNGSEKQLNGVKVLVVEDSPDNQQLIRRYLSKQGAEVEVANNGVEGVKRALAGNHDVVLMDIQMPVLDGYTATGNLRSYGYKKPILALTAHAMTDVRRKCMDAGCTDHLAKPVNSKELIQAVSRYSRNH